MMPNLQSSMPFYAAIRSLIFKDYLMIATSRIWFLPYISTWDMYIKAHFKSGNKC